MQFIPLQPIEERSSSGLGSRAFNPLTGVRIPYALPVLYVFDIKHTVPAHERNSRAGRGYLWAVSSAAEQRLYTANVGGSIPSRPTIFYRFRYARSTIASHIRHDSVAYAIWPESMM